ncbi:MAG: DUF805 domain-containing protein [Patescibacteria group bacterium]
MNSKSYFAGTLLAVLVFIFNLALVVLNIISIELAILIVFLIVIYYCSLVVRRAHDRNYSGWKGFVFIAGILQMEASKGNSNPNKYGDPPPPEIRLP